MSKRSPKRPGSLNGEPSSHSETPVGKPSFKKQDFMKNFHKQGGGGLLVFILLFRNTINSGTDTEFYVPDLRYQAAIMVKFRAFMLNPDLFWTIFWHFGPDPEGFT